MLFHPISFALLALSLVHASPNPLPADGILPSSIDVARRAPVSVKITSVASLNPVVTFSGPPPLEVLVGQAAAPPGNFGIWERSELSADKYIFQNLGTGQWITVNAANIKLPDADSLWEALFDGTSPIFGRIIMSPASGSTLQRWKLA
ncbi:hypothetical protein B0H17DRAFT_1133786 [Mycena rosella]|uniref:Uncharacterized protein n=1 Tax=Mycena rosella TaxID=1033263 RepID=A0AAD7GHS8_MYCRO|nr:hypothetical protein B0H17DRAFT_1133786 [Mycena rosella]